MHILLKSNKKRLNMAYKIKFLREEDW